MSVAIRLSAEGLADPPFLADIFTLSPLHLHDDVFRAIDKTFMINPSPSDVSTTNTPRAGGKLVAFDFAPVLSFQLRPPRTAGTEAPRVTFPTTLDMNPYLPSSWPPVAKYDAFPRQSRRSNHFRLHTVICQLPDVNIPSIIAEGKRVCNSSYAFIRPSPDGPWFLHRNDRVVPVTEKEVLETAYGGRGVAQTKKYGAAVSLVYVDEEFERTRKVKEPKAGYLIRELASFAPLSSFADSPLSQANGSRTTSRSRRASIRVPIPCSTRRSSSSLRRWESPPPISRASW